MRWVVAAVGRLKEGFYREGVAEYANRLSRGRTLRVVEVAEAELRGERIHEGLRQEADRLRQATRGCRLVALTERGERLSTEALAARLDQFEREGQDLAFILGGPDGLEPALEADAAWRLSLSDLTLPYQLARLVLLEQLYRCETIRRNEPYHRGDLPARKGGGKR